MCLLLLSNAGFQYHPRSDTNPVRVSEPDKIFLYLSLSWCPFHEKKIRGRDLFRYCPLPDCSLASLSMPFSRSTLPMLQSRTNSAALKVSSPSPRFVHKVLNSLHHKYFSFQCKPSYLHKGSCIFRAEKKEPMLSHQLFSGSPLKLKLCLSGLFWNISLSSVGTPKTTPTPQGLPLPLQGLS